jgi:hypothetical protein
MQALTTQLPPKRVKMTARVVVSPASGTPIKQPPLLATCNRSCCIHHPYLLPHNMHSQHGLSAPLNAVALRAVSPVQVVTRNAWKVQLATRAITAHRVCSNLH